MNELSNTILEKIKHDQVRPIPRWEFLLKDWVIWAGFAVSVIVGSVAYCVALFMLTTQDWDIYRYVGSNPFVDALSGLPYVWLVLLILFAALAYYQIRHTQSGYRYRVIGVILVSIGASIIFGTILHLSGFGDYIDNAMARNLSVYRHLTPDRQAVWTQPEKGLLAGKITDISNSQSGLVTIKDFHGHSWLIQYHEAVIDPRVKVRIGEYIKMVGEQLDATHFMASEILPWQMSRWIDEYESTNEQSVIIFPNDSQPIIIQFN